MKYMYIYRETEKERERERQRRRKRGLLVVSISEERNCMPSRGARPPSLPSRSAPPPNLSSCSPRPPSLVRERVTHRDALYLNKKERRV